MNLSNLELFRSNPNFRKLLFGQYISELGNWFNFIAGFELIRIVTNGSSSSAGLLMFWRTLPFALVIPFAGLVADRFSRRSVMIFSDVFRAGIALLFLLVENQDQLWIAYGASVLLAVGTAFFEGAKNASVPNISGKEGLLSATALMFSTRFILMAVGAALGGIAASFFGYKVAFLINAISFLASAVFIWFIPAENMHEVWPPGSGDESAENSGKSAWRRVYEELTEGIRYTFTTRFALTVLMLNIIWAIGGGATNIVFDGLAGKVFSDDSMDAGTVFWILLTANGIGLTIGVLFAKRFGDMAMGKGVLRGYMGWALILHGLLFAAVGFTPFLWGVIVLLILSRILIAAQYTVQETVFQRTIPDKIRARILTFDRGAEITMYSMSAYFTGVSLTIVSPETAVIVAGCMAASAGVVWLIRTRTDEDKRALAVASKG